MDSGNKSREKKIVKIEISLSRILEKSSYYASFQAYTVTYVKLNEDVTVS
ncbi:MAG: hypothetical protein ABFC98_03765 [Candidatus Cloacimonas sp.]